MCFDIRGKTRAYRDTRTPPYTIRTRPRHNTTAAEAHNNGGAYGMHSSEHTWKQRRKEAPRLYVGDIVSHGVVLLSQGPISAHPSHPITAW